MERTEYGKKTSKEFCQKKKKGREFPVVVFHASVKAYKIKMEKQFRDLVVNRPLDFQVLVS